MTCEEKNTKIKKLIEEREVIAKMPPHSFVSGTKRFSAYVRYNQLGNIILEECLDAFESGMEFVEVSEYHEVSEMQKCNEEII